LSCTILERLILKLRCKHDFRTPAGLEFPILERDTEKIRKTSHDDGFMSFNDDAHSWTRDIPWLRSVTRMQIWIKGVLTAEDTLKAIEMGCDGIIVSNVGRFLNAPCPILTRTHSARWKTA